MNNDSERKIVSCSRNGDKFAYTKLVKAYSRRVFAICLSMTCNSHDAEDIAQQVLLKGFIDINQLRDDEQFGAWISKIARNLCIDFIRKQKHKKDLSIEQIGTVQNSAEDFSKLRLALARLPEEYQSPLVLYYFDGCSTKNIAEALNISLAAAQARLSRARKKLRKLLEVEGGT